MTDLERAKLELVGDKTCVLVKGNTIYYSTMSGIAPMIDFIDRKIDLTGFSVADKIVGKAVAMLFILKGIKSVYAEVISKSALDFLKSNGVNVKYATLTERIINRKGDRLCPMESTVLNIDDCNLAYIKLKEKLNSLRANKK